MHQHAAMILRRQCTRFVPLLQPRFRTMYSQVAFPTRPATGCKKATPAKTPDTLGIDVSKLRPLAEDHLQNGRPKAAAELLECSLAVQEQTLGCDHLSLSTTLLMLALARVRAQQPAKSAEVSMRCLIIQKRKLGREHPALLPAISLFAQALVALGNPSEASRFSKTLSELNIPAWQRFSFTWQA